MRCKHISTISPLSSFCIALISKSPQAARAARPARSLSLTSKMASKSGKPLKHHSVVSSFIIKYEDGKPSVALFRRSDKVNTYQ